MEPDKGEKEAFEPYTPKLDIREPEETIVEQAIRKQAQALDKAIMETIEEEETKTQAPVREIREPVKRRAEFAPLPPEAVEQSVKEPPAKNGKVNQVAIPGHQIRPFVKAAHAILSKVAESGSGTLLLPVGQMLIVLTADQEVATSIQTVIEVVNKQRQVRVQAAQAAQQPATPQEPTP